MARIGYEEALKRFSHIDARFVSCEMGLPDKECTFKVEIYPWWEHPLFLQARAEGKAWGFSGVDEGYKTVTVYATGVQEFKISAMVDVIDWTFTRDHPILWSAQPQGEIYSNSSLTAKQLAGIFGEVAKALGGDVNLENYASLPNILKWCEDPSFYLGSFPLPVYRAFCESLDSRSLPYYGTREPRWNESPVLFLIDDESYVIAENFELEIPEFVHRPEWFKFD